MKLILLAQDVLTAHVRGYTNLEMAENIEQSNDSIQSNIWCLTLDNGGERELTSSDLIECIVRSQRWKYQQHGYLEIERVVG